RKVEPHRVEGMEVYSTILWHLRKEVELSYLAHQLVEFDRMAPESWCAVGNCFSLQKEPKTALKTFQRVPACLPALCRGLLIDSFVHQAIQLNPGFTYAYTLSGHEYIAND